MNSCAWLLHPNIKNQGKGMLEVPWLAVELKEWFASSRSTFHWISLSVSVSCVSYFQLWTHRSSVYFLYLTSFIFNLIGRRSRFLSFLVSCLELTSLFHSFSFLISQVFPAVTDDFILFLFLLYLVCLFPNLEIQFLIERMRSHMWGRETGIQENIVSSFSRR